MVSGNSLADHYKSNFLLSYKFKFGLEYLDSIIPFERDIYISLLVEQLEKENKSK